MEEFWNERYANNEYVYGENPNEFLEEQLAHLPQGKILLPCEGEGRNAVYAAQNGWHVFACDFSSTGKQKAMALARKKGISFEYAVCGILEYPAEAETFDVIALIFAHFPETVRQKIHEKMITLLKPGGWIVLEGFNKKQLGKNSGGPKSLEMLFDANMLLKDFENCEIVSLEEKTVFLKEGLFHEGEAEVIRGLFRKKN